MDLGDGKFQCLNCSFRMTMKQMGERQKQEAKSKQTRIRNAKARKKNRLHILILILACLGGLFAAVKMLVRPPSPPPAAEPFVPSRDSSAFVLFVNQALRAYATDHGGAVPDRLEELLGQYLPPEKIGTPDLETLVYVRKSPSSYELKAKKPSTQQTPGLVFTEDGVWIGGKFEKD